MANQKYHIKDAILKPAAHHESFQKLWETKWKAPASLPQTLFSVLTQRAFLMVLTR